MMDKKDNGVTQHPRDLLILALTFAFKLCLQLNKFLAAIVLFLVLFLKQLHHNTQPEIEAFCLHLHQFLKTSIHLRHVPRFFTTV